MPKFPRREWPERRDGPVDYDAELQCFTAALRRAYGIGPRDHVLDIGCGAGQTTREAGSTQRILEAAGFVNASFTDVNEPVYYGPDVSAALEWVRGFASVEGALQRLDPPSRERTLDRLRDALAAHAGRNGVWLDGRAWIVAAQRH